MKHTTCQWMWWFSAWCALWIYFGDPVRISQSGRYRLRIQRRVDTACDVPRRVRSFGVIQIIEEPWFDESGMGVSSRVWRYVVVRYVRDACGFTIGDIFSVLMNRTVRILTETNRRTKSKGRSTKHETRNKEKWDAITRMKRWERGDKNQTQNLTEIQGPLYFVRG